MCMHTTCDGPSHQTNVTYVALDLERLGLTGKQAEPACGARKALCACTSERTWQWLGALAEEGPCAPLHVLLRVHCQGDRSHHLSYALVCTGSELGACGRSCQASVPGRVPLHLTLLHACWRSARWPVAGAFAFDLSAHLADQDSLDI